MRLSNGDERNAGEGSDGRRATRLDRSRNYGERLAARYLDRPAGREGRAGTAGLGGNFGN